MMAGIRATDTVPELVVRRFLHSRGFRYRLHRADLPGKPDIVLPKYRAVVMVHGCYWHRHHGCKLAYNPKTRQEFWESKFNSNVKRDARNREQLLESGWRVMTIWECLLRDNSLRDEGLEYLAYWLRSKQRLGEIPVTTPLSI